MAEQLGDLLDFAQELTWQAGKITLRYFQTDITPDLKADHSPVTIADQESEQFMRHRILSTYPHHAVLGEEDGISGNADAEWRWILDPIDGTRSFVRGVPLYGVMAGLVYHGEPVLGVVNIPALSELVAAAKGHGCRLNGRPCHVSQTATLAEGLLLSTVDSPKFYQHNKGAAFDRLRARAGIFRTWGDCYGYLLVASGRAEVMLDPAMSIWDTAALLPILHEAGGTFTDWQGNATIEAGEAIGTNGLILDEVLALVAGQAANE